MPTYYTRDIIYEDKWAEDMRNSEAVFRRTFVGNQKNGNYYGKVVPWDVLHKVSNGVKDRQAETFLFLFPVRLLRINIPVILQVLMVIFLSFIEMIIWHVYRKLSYYVRR